MNLKISSLVAATVLVAGTIVVIAALAATAPAYAQGNDWCYTRIQSGIPVNVYGFEDKRCFPDRGECNQAQANDNAATSSCFRDKP
jgi:hypothetical protein